MGGIAGTLPVRNIVRLAVLTVTLSIQSACSGQTDLSFFVLVKSSNYAQDSSGQLTLLNYHFFSEVFLTEGGSLERATLTLADETSGPVEYVNRGSNYYVEGGHFDTLEELDRTYPNGTFTFDIVAPSVQIAGEELQLAGPDGETDLPAPITISLFQQGRAVSPLEIDPQQELVVRWSDYSNGRLDPRGIVNDMIFVVVADCHGQRLYHTGLPFQGEYLTFETTEVAVNASTLSSGQPYSMFVEFPHVVDSRVINGVPGFTSYATATYLDLRTTGASSDTGCPDVPPPMDTGQTDRGHR
jgi:hypothetical protein